jgi:hypothetical protein
MATVMVAEARKMLAIRREVWNAGIDDATCAFGQASEAGATGPWLSRPQIKGLRQQGHLPDDRGMVASAVADSFSPAVSFLGEGFGQAPLTRWRLSENDNQNQRRR